MADTEKQRSTRLIDRIKTYVSLGLESIRLTLAEKIILLLSTVLTVLVALIIGGIAVMFVTFAIAHVLSLWLPLWAAYAIMAGVNILLLLIVLIFRRALILNPVSRAITKIILS